MLSRRVRPKKFAIARTSHSATVDDGDDAVGDVPSTSGTRVVQTKPRVDTPPPRATDASTSSVDKGRVVPPQMNAMTRCASSPVDVDSSAPPTMHDDQVADDVSMPPLETVESAVIAPLLLKPKYTEIVSASVQLDKSNTFGKFFADNERLTFDSSHSTPQSRRSSTHSSVHDAAPDVPDATRAADEIDNDTDEDARDDDDACDEIVEAADDDEAVDDKVAGKPMSVTESVRLWEDRILQSEADATPMTTGEFSEHCGDLTSGSPNWRRIRRLCIKMAAVWIAFMTIFIMSVFRV